MHRHYKAKEKASTGVWKTLAVGAALTGAVALAGAWLLGYFSEHPAVAEVNKIRDQLADPNLSEDSRRELFASMRTTMESMPEDLRRDLWRENRERFEQRADQRMRQVLAMPPAERAKAIDEDIKRQEERRQRWAQRQEGNGGNAGQQPNRNRTLTDEQRIERTRSRLDRSTAEQRSLRNQYRRLVEQRRKQLGLQPGGGGRGRGRG